MTTVIIVLTVAVSLFAFYDRAAFGRLCFSPYEVKRRSQWYRFFTYGLVHADWVHLGINMFVLYSFGEASEYFFRGYFGSRGLSYFLFLYVGGILVSVVPSYGRHKNDPGYSAVGASGAVAAVVFATIVFHPLGKIGFLFLPFAIPSFIFGALYLAYSAYMDKRGTDNIGHNAHFWGAIFGLAYPVLLNPRLAVLFWNKIASLL